MAPKPRTQSQQGFLTAILVVGGAAIAFAMIMNRSMKQSPSEQIGHEFPPIEVVGWLNGSGPTSEQLRGDVVVIDAWAYWCGPCRAVTPHLIRLHEKYKGQGVKFIGLTAEGGDSASKEKSREYVQSAKIPWPNGYGAVNMLTSLNVEAIPQLWVVDRQNRIIYHEIGWSPASIQEVEVAVKKALADTGSSSTEK